MMYKIEIKKITSHRKYKTQYANLGVHQTNIIWQGLNIGNGYRARLIDQATDKVIARKE